MEYNKQCGCQPGKINGIKCEVANCQFHVPGDVCEAGEIIVGCHDKSSSASASCTTYKAKETR